MTKILKRPLSVLLAVLMIAGIFTAVPMTAYAAPTETLLTTITATGKEQASYSTENVATVSFSYTAGGSSSYMNNGTTATWGWWGYGWTATVTPADGYTITKCVFYDDKDRTATDSEAPFVVETTEEDKTPQVNGTPILAYTSKGITKIEVYGYAMPAHTHSFTYSASGATITATCGEGCDITTGLTLSISAPTGDLVADGTKTFPAILNTGYNTTAFPEGSISDISYTKDGQPYNGTPTEAGAYVASVTVGTATASVSYTVISALAAAKTAAKGELDTLLAGKNEADYDADDWTALTQAITDGKSAIDNAATTDDVATAKSNAETAVNAIKTTAEKAAEALATAKTTAKGELDTLLAGKNEADYDANDWTALTQAITDGKTAIDNATTTDAVATAKSNAETAVNAIKTTAEKAAEALATAKTTAKGELDTLLAGKNEADYDANDWTALTQAITDGKTAIDNATTIDDVATAKSNAETAVNAIKTKAEKKDAADTAAANGASDTINALPAAANVTVADKATIEAARAAYDALTADQKAKVSADTVKKLTDAESALEVAETAAKINALPAAENVTTADKADIEAARAAYDALTDDQKAKVDAETLKKLTDDEKALEELKKASLLPAPSVKNYIDTGKKQVTVDITAVKGATDYKIIYRKQGATKWTSVNTKGKTKYVVNKLESNGAYELRVRAYVKQNGKTAKTKWSHLSRRFIADVTLNKPTAAKGSAKVSWSKNAKASGYEVIYSTKRDMSGSKSVTVKGGSKTSYTIKNLKSGKKYYVRVRAFITKGGQNFNGPFADVKSIIVK